MKHKRMKQGNAVQVQPAPTPRTVWSAPLTEQILNFQAFDQASRALEEAATHIENGVKLMQQARLAATDITCLDSKRLFNRAVGQMKAALDQDFFGQQPT